MLTLAGYSAYFLEQAGLSSNNALSFALGQYSINCVGVFGAWALMSWGIGRRRLYLLGLCGLFTMLLILGFLGLVPKSQNDAASLAAGSIMLVWAMCYQLSVGTVCYSLVGELSTRRLQIKTVASALLKAPFVSTSPDLLRCMFAYLSASQALGRICYNLIAIICSVITPYMLNPSQW